MAARKDPLLVSLPPFSEYAPQIDWQKVEDAIIGDGKLAEYDLADSKTMVWSAAEKFLPRDLYDLDIDGVEEPYEATLELPYGPQVFKGIKDLKGRLRGRLNATKKYAGKKVVVDWKSTANTLDKTWEDRLLDSWQWRKYLYFENADVMIYRGLGRDSSGEVKFREVFIERPAKLEEDILVQLQGCAISRQSLIEAGLEVWPRKMPSACGAFGRECPYFLDCRDGSMPRGAVLPGRSFSYSSMDKYLLCPERYRREILSEGQEDTEESLFGQAVHRGLAEVYTQARNLFQK